MNILPGKTYRFAYPYWGYDPKAKTVCDTGAMPEYESRRGALVTVVRAATVEDGYDEEVLPQFLIRDEGGWEGSADPSELVDADTDDEGLYDYIAATFYGEPKATLPPRI